MCSLCHLTTILYEELADMISEKFLRKRCFVVQCTGVMSQQLAKHDGNCFPTGNIIILVFQIIYSSFKTLI